MAGDQRAPVKADVDAAKDLLSIILGEVPYSFRLRKAAEHFARHRQREL